MPVLERHAPLIQSVDPFLSKEYRISGRFHYLLIYAIVKLMIEENGCQLLEAILSYSIRH